MPDEGLIVWHVDELGSNNNEQMTSNQHYEASVEQADGLFHLERHQSTGGPNDLFHVGNGTNTFCDTIIPDARWWSGATAGTNGSGTASGMYIHSISAAAEMMTFVIGTGAVDAVASIGLDETLLMPRCDCGTNAAIQKFGVWNKGGGTLAYTVGSDVPWMTCVPSNGSVTTEGNIVSARFATATLNPGSYTGTVTVSAPGATNNPQTILVVLTVNGLGWLELSTNMIRQTTYAGATGIQRTFTVRNRGDGLLAYRITTNVTWLSVVPTNGTRVSGESPQ